MLERLKKLINGKSLCILGFGREGQSTYHTIRKISKDIVLTIADNDHALLYNLPFLNEDINVNFHGGSDYLSVIHTHDIIFKTPGITINQLPESVLPKITSQTEIFMEEYRERIIGITGTKGKSTTASLVDHILRGSGQDALLVGNIGLPPFEVINEIKDDTHIVYELSSHQLETVNVSPHIAVILNFFEEHLDHYNSYSDYKNAKMNIARYQSEKDVFLYCDDNKELKDAVETGNFRATTGRVSLLSDDNMRAYIKNESIILMAEDTRDELILIKDILLKGEHNLINCMIAATVCRYLGVSNEEIVSGFMDFKGLKHRIEYAGIFGGVHFYDDSIATIPQATIEAIKTVGNVEFLILGGQDRGVDYTYLASYLSKIDIRYILCIDKAGERISMLLNKMTHNSYVKVFSNYREIFEFIRSKAGQGDTCLLSPAAASYGMFKNFEERGDLFIELAKGLE